MTDKMLNIQAVPHPFSVERIDCALPLGLSAAEIINTVQPDPVLKQHVHVFINGDYIPPENWARLSERVYQHNLAVPFHCH